jgi:hypothetical protein
MLQEREIINLIIEEKVMASPSLHLQLADMGYLNSKNLPFNKAQIDSLLHSARQEQRKRNHKYVESCGIDRAKNPCGDASDY